LSSQRNAESSARYRKRLKIEDQVKEAQLQELKSLVAEQERELQQVEASIARLNDDLAADLAKYRDLNEKFESLQSRYWFLKGRLSTTKASGSR
jgi:flagellar motility protein MotE (MotC chaperone)